MNNQATESNLMLCVQMVGLHSFQISIKATPGRHGRGWVAGDESYMHPCRARSITQLSHGHVWTESHCFGLLLASWWLYIAKIKMLVPSLIMSITWWSRFCCRCRCPIICGRLVDKLLQEGTACSGDSHLSEKVARFWSVGEGLFLMTKLSILSI